MKRLIFLLFAALVFPSCNNSTSISSNEKNSNKKDWVKFESKEGGYVISHPDYELQQSDKVGFLPELGDYIVHMNNINSQKENDDNLGYSFNYTTYANAVLFTDKESIRERCKQNIYKKAEAVQAEVELLTFSDYKGVEMCEAQIAMKHQPIILRARLFIVDQKEYEIFVVTNDSNAFNLSTKNFFDSFDIIGKTTKL